jgi:hypothetical protein
MYQVEMRKPDSHRWVRIWESEDGHDAADYLCQQVKYELRKGVEYRMVYIVQECATAR